VPQGKFNLSSKNMVFGEAVNPRNFDRSCGGSSGGDAGLVASKCVPFSLASDHTGGIRYPAAFCGIYGMKPTQRRCTSRGIGAMNRLRFDHFNHHQAVGGPLASSVDDCILAMKVQFDQNVQLLDPQQTPS
jgi:Asp-tRNA(Asn)/Glu-tRNA(Gln) amidotransferase A subunit family amidase